MNLLIESGATKSTCIGYSGTCTFFMYKTAGVNATYASKEAVHEIICEIIAKNNLEVSTVQQIRYYGAGCFNSLNAKKIKEVLCNLFPKANITVLSDLYAACHALCKQNKGFVGILGTGAASCFYDGEQIVSRAPSLGWLLGDEGSGVHLGKLFVTKYLSDEIEPDVAQDFEKTFDISKPLVLEKVYQTPQPQTFFAEIPVFLNNHLDNKQVKTIIENAFQAFFKQQMNYYREFPHPWHFCGSVAYHFQEILLETARRNNIVIEKIIPECAGELLY